MEGYFRRSLFDREPRTPDVGGVARNLGRVADAEEREAKAEEKQTKQQGKASSKKDDSSSRSSESSFGTAKWLTIFLIVWGLIHYLARVNNIGADGFILTSSIILLACGIWALALRCQGKRLAVLMPILFFFIWYYVYDSNYSPAFLGVFLGTFVGVSLIIAFFAKWESITPELVGFVPVLFYFVDAGLLHFMTIKLELTVTPILSTLINDIPWWTLYGLFTIPDGAIKGKWFESFIGIGRVIAGLFLIFTLITPMIAGFGYEKNSLLPGVAQLEAARKNVEKNIPQGEQPAWSNIVCMVNDPQNVASCVAQRQEDSQIRSFCKQQVAQGVYGIQEVCEEEQKKIKEEEKMAARSSTATNFDKVTKATFKIDTENDPFSKTFSGVLIIDNPREQPLSVKASCHLKRGTEDKEQTISLFGKGNEPIGFRDEVKEIPFTCTLAPDTPLGKYELEFSAQINGLKTTSWVKRTFFASEEERKRYKDQVMQDHYHSKVETLSQAPAEFARLNVEFGTLRGNPLIVAGQPVLAWVSLENIGKGQVRSVHSYELTTLREDGFSIKEGDANCLEGSSLDFPEEYTKKLTGNILFAKRCFLTIPSGFVDVSGDGKTKTFLANVIYDYIITDKIAVELKEVPSLETSLPASPGVS